MKKFASANDERLVPDFERTKELEDGPSCANINKAQALFIATEIAKELGINNKIYEIGSDRVVHFEGIINDRKKREQFEEKMSEKMKAKWKMTAFWS